MLRRIISEDVGVTRKEFFTVFILLFNAFTWWYMTLTILDIIAQTNLGVWTIYYTTVIASGLIGSILSHKIRRLNFLYFWMLFGTATSLLPPLLGNMEMVHVLVVSFLLGASFGLGIPSCVSYFADFTIVENRGRLGGVIYFTILVSLSFFIMLTRMSDLATGSIISFTWRGLGLIMFFSLKPKEKVDAANRKNPSFISILRGRSVILYLIPWIMFGLVNRLEAPILSKLFGPDFYGFMILIETILGSLFALVGGVLSDFIGRKRIIIYGFISLGLAYALIGLAPTNVIFWYFYSTIDSIAMGIFLAIFILILWGDLSQPGEREKYYLIGSVPFLLTDLMQLFLSPYVMLIPEYAAFSLASFFLFLAVLPLMYAPETLPEKKIELRRLRGYIEQAKKVREKYSRKSDTEG